MNDLGILPTLTYQVINGRIYGMVDGVEAVRQAVEKILLTERFVYPIYDDQYGHDLLDLIGKDFPYVKVEVKRMVKEALKADDRITGVKITKMEQTDLSTLSVLVEVSTIYGDFKTKTEVTR